MSAPVVFLRACSADLGDVRAFLGEAIDASGAKALFQEYSLPVVSGSPREMIETSIPRAVAGLSLHIHPIRILPRAFAREKSLYVPLRGERV